MAMSMRMVPIRATFRKMERLVRDVAAKQQKEVQLIVSGEDTEVDRTIAEKFADPLMHMIRNAVDHAIELPGKRIAEGKPPMGTIHLRAFHRGGQYHHRGGRRRHGPEPRAHHGKGDQAWPASPRRDAR